MSLGRPASGHQTNGRRRYVPLPSGKQAHLALTVHDKNFSEDERSRTGLDAPHNADRQWIRQALKSDLSTEAQGSTWAFVYLTPSSLCLARCHTTTSSLHSLAQLEPVKVFLVNPLTGLCPSHDI